MRSIGAVLVVAIATIAILSLAEVRVSPSNLYGLEIAELERPYATALFTGSKVLVGGEGYVARVDLERKRVDSQLAIIGSARVLALDSLPGEWAAVGTDRGEIVIVSLTTMTKRTSTFVASRAPISSVHLVRTGATSKIIALDEAGFLYVMGTVRGIFSGGWFEVGPVPHKGALSGIYDVKVLRVYPTVAPLSWTSEIYLGDKVVMFLDVSLPGPSVINSFLGGAVAELFYRDSAILPAYAGVTRIGNDTEIERNIYYAVVRDSMILPISPVGEELMRGNQTLSILGLPPGSYKLVALYEIKTKDVRRGILTASSCYAGAISFQVEPGELARLPSVVLERKGSYLHECLHGFEVDGKPLSRLMKPRKVQALLLIDASGLPGEYRFSRDVSTIIVPITGEMVERGVEDIAAHSAAALVRPLSPLPGMSGRADAVLFVAVKEWLFIYYLGPGLAVSDVGYPQPQIIYIGEETTSLDVSPDARRVYVGTASGTVYRLLWLRDHPLFPQGELRYYIDSSLHVGGSPISSARELENGELLMIATRAGRIQLVSIAGRSWDPVWRSDREFVGVETGLRDLAVIWRGSKEVVLASPGSDKLYAFRLQLTGISPVEVRLSLVEFEDEGGWRLRAMDGARIYAVSGGKLVVASTVANGTAKLYLPPGRYELFVELEALRSKGTSLLIGEGYTVVEALAIAQPDHLVVEPIINRDLIASIVELYIPKINVELQIRDVDGNPIEAGKRAVLTGTRGTFSAITRQGAVSIAQVPVGLYTLIIQEPGTNYEPLRAQIRVTLRGAEPSVVLLKPKAVPVTISLRDSLLHLDVKERFVVRIERLGAAAALDYPREVRFGGSTTIHLPLGTYRLTLRAAEPSMYMEPSPTTIVVDGEKRVTISLSPKEFPVRVEVRDSWNNPVEGARLLFLRTEGMYEMEAVTSKEGVAELSLPYGKYELIVEGRFYRRISEEIEVSDGVEKKVKLEPTLPLLVLRYAPYGGLLVGIAIAAIVIRRLRKLVEERMKEEYF